VVTVAAVLLVAAVAAIVSYAHMREVATRAGEGWRALLLPLSVDGLVIAASMTLVTRRRAGVPGGGLAWVALLGGVGASLAANVAAADPSVTARLVAAWPALAFAVAFELLLQQRRVGAPAPVAEAVVPDPVPPPVAQVTEVPPPVAAPAPAAELPNPADDHRPVGDPAGDPLPAAPVPDADLAARIGALVREAETAGQPLPGRRRLAEALGVTQHAIRTASNGAAPEENPR